MCVQEGCGGERSEPGSSPGRELRGGAGNLEVTTSRAALLQGPGRPTPRKPRASARKSCPAPAAQPLEPDAANRGQHQSRHRASHGQVLATNTKPTTVQTRADTPD